MRSSIPWPVAFVHLLISVTGARLIISDPSADMLGLVPATSDTTGHGAYVHAKIRRKSPVLLNHSLYARRLISAQLTNNAANVDNELHALLAVANASAGHSSVAADNGPLRPAGRNGTATATAADNDVERACAARFAVVPPTTTARTQSEPGFGACYAVDAFDGSTGAFRASLLLYGTTAVAVARGTVIRVAVAMPGAAVVAMAPTTMAGRREEEEEKEERGDGVPQTVARLAVAGQVLEPFKGALANASSMRLALSPLVTLSILAPDAGNGSSTTTTTTTTTLAPDAVAAFLTGYFSTTDDDDDHNNGTAPPPSADADGSVSTSSPSPSPSAPVVVIAAVAAVASASASASPAFVLAGVGLGVFPVGLAVVCVWTVLLAVAVALGTFGRVRCREAYRRERALAATKDEDDIFTRGLR